MTIKKIREKLGQNDKEPWGLFIVSILVAIVLTAFLCINTNKTRPYKSDTAVKTDKATEQYYYIRFVEPNDYSHVNEEKLINIRTFE